MNNIFKYSFLFILITLFSCDEDKYLESDLRGFVSFEATPVLVEIEENATKTLDVAVAASNSTNSQRTFNVVIDEDNTTLQSPFNVPETVTIPANSKETTLSVEVTDDESLGFIRQDLTFNFENEVGTDFGEPVTIQAAEECLETLVTLNLTLDVWPNETTWQIFDLSDPNNPTQIASGGPYAKPEQENVELPPINFCLSSGDYGLVMNDSFGDGGPTYSVTSPNGVLVEENTLEDDQATATFTVE